jgi:hypothetical protein
MTINKRLPWIAGALCTLLTAPAFGAITWNFNIPSNTGCVSGATTNYGNTCTRTGSDGATDATASAWANTGNGNTTHQTAYLAGFGSNGLGVQNRDQPGGGGDGNDDTENNSSQAEHAMDNEDRFDMILFSFEDVMNMQSVKLGFPSGDSPDSDITVLAFNMSHVDPSIDGKTLPQLVAAGWEYVGDYANVSLQPNDTAILGTSIASKYWLVAAYNPAWCTEAGSDCSSSGAGTGSKDKVKVLEVAGDKPRRDVPEPGTLFLLGAAIAMGAWTKRRASAH